MNWAEAHICLIRLCGFCSKVSQNGIIATWNSDSLNISRNARAQVSHGRSSIFCYARLLDRIRLVLCNQPNTSVRNAFRANASLKLSGGMFKQLNMLHVRFVFQSK